MSGERNAAGLLHALEQTFGDGIVTGTRPNERIWPGGEVFVLYDLDAETGRGMAAMTSTPIHASAGAVVLSRHRRTLFSAPT